MEDITEQNFWLLEREAAISAELITIGLETLRKVDRGLSFYYPSFYSLSTGLERLAKLILHVRNPDVNLRDYGHKLYDLRDAIGLETPFQPVEEEIFQFLNDFANGERYTILDCFSSGSIPSSTNEPIAKFYETIMLKIIKEHQIDKSIEFDNDLGTVFGVNEKWEKIKDLTELINHVRNKNEALKYCSMYCGRMLQPFLNEIVSCTNVPDTPYFNDYFRFLIQGDEYFRTRKTYRS